MKYATLTFTFYEPSFVASWYVQSDRWTAACTSQVQRWLADKGLIYTSTYVLYNSSHESMKWKFTLSAKRVLRKRGGSVCNENITSVYGSVYGDIYTYNMYVHLQNRNPVLSNDYMVRKLYARIGEYPVENGRTSVRVLERYLLKFSHFCLNCYWVVTFWPNRNKKPHIFSF